MRKFTKWIVRILLSLSHFLSNVHNQHYYIILQWQKFCLSPSFFFGSYQWEISFLQTQPLSWKMNATVNYNLRNLLQISFQPSLDWELGMCHCTLQGDSKPKTSSRWTSHFLALTISHHISAYSGIFLICKDIICAICSIM